MALKMLNDSNVVQLFCDYVKVVLFRKNNFSVGFSCGVAGGVAATVLVIIYRKWNRGLDTFINLADMWLSLQRQTYQIGESNLAQGIDELRKDFAAMYMGPVVPMKSKVEHLLLCEMGHKVPLHIYTPKKCGANCPLIVYLHGGGFVIGNPLMYEPNTTSIAEATGSIVVAIDYRKAPEHKFPSAITDCIEAIKWIHSHASELGADPNKLVIMGDSAGGNLTIITSLELSNIVKLSIPIYPATRFGIMVKSKVRNCVAPFLKSLSIDWYNLRHFRTAQDLFDPLACPFSRTDLATAPRTHVITAEFDALVDEGFDYAEALRAVSADPGKVTYKEYKNTIHGFFGISFLTHGTAAFEDICHIINNHFA